MLGFVRELLILAVCFSIVYLFGERGCWLVLAGLSTYMLDKVFYRYMKF